MQERTTVTKTPTVSTAMEAFAASAIQASGATGYPAFGKKCHFPLNDRLVQVQPEQKSTFMLNSPRASVR